MKVKIELTFSKLLALLTLIAAVYLDITNEGIQAFLIAIPFMAGIIGSKQWNDARKQIKMKGHEVYGCTDPKAKNYNMAATHDDGTCEYLADPVGGE